MKCAARGCECQVAPVEPQDRWIRCNEHRVLWERLQVDLPRAIQELHALGLLYPSIFGTDWHDKGYGDLTRLRVTITCATDRVVRLRGLEAELRGETP
jgi:hypothetical protein